MKKLIILTVFICVLIGSMAVASADEQQDLERVFREIQIGKPLPTVNYVFLPQKKSDKVTSYEGRLNKLTLSVETLQRDETEIVSNFTVTLIENDGEQRLNLISDYLGKPTDKKDLVKNGQPIKWYLAEYKDHWWWLFVSPRSFSLLAGITPEAVSQK